ncbi:MAG: PAS domain S-box protein [Anaeromyxobacter sp.]
MESGPDKPGRRHSLPLLIGLALLALMALALVALSIDGRGLGPRELGVRLALGALVALVSADMARRLVRGRRLFTAGLEASRQSSVRYRALFDSMTDALVTVDLAGRIISFNEPFRVLLGRPADELLRLTYQDLTPRQWHAMEAAVVGDLLRRDRSEVYEKEYLRGDGQPVPVELKTFLVRDADGTPTSMSAIVRDISARKRMEDQLRESEARFRRLFDGAADAVFVHDRQGRIVDANRAASESVGYTRDELLRLGVADVQASLRPAELAEAWERVCDGTSVTVDGVHRRRDGSTFPVEVHVALLAAGDDPLLIAAARDITERRHAEAERRRLEEDLRQSQKVEAIGRVAGGVAHDFNNVLTVILSCSATLRDAARQGKVPDREEVEDLVSAAERARAITRQLLAFSRRDRVDPQPVDLNRFLEDSRKLHARLLGDNVELSLALEPGLGAVLCDPAHLDQVLLNLVANARDALARGGQVRLATGQVTLGEGDRTWPGLPAGRYVRLEVSDDGEGMTPEVAERVFDPFFTTKPEGRGTGLGLATVHRIVRDAGGAVRVQSAPGLGATFQVLLPWRGPVAAWTARAHDPGIRGGSETILLVEDEPDIRRVAARALARAGYRVHVAAHGAEALELAGQVERPDLVVTDIIMPRLDGPRLADALRRCWPGIPLLFTSGYTDDRLASSGALGEEVVLLRKPFTAADLLGRVRSVLDQVRPG